MWFALIASCAIYNDGFRNSGVQLDGGGTNLDGLGDARRRGRRGLRRRLVLRLERDQLDVERKDGVGRNDGWVSACACWFEINAMSMGIGSAPQCAESVP